MLAPSKHVAARETAGVAGVFDTVHRRGERSARRPSRKSARRRTLMSVDLRVSHLSGAGRVVGALAGRSPERVSHALAGLFRPGRGGSR